MKPAILAAAFAFSQLFGISVAWADSMQEPDGSTVFEWAGGQSWEGINRSSSGVSPDSLLGGGSEFVPVSTMTPAANSYASEVQSAGNYGHAPWHMDSAFALTALSGAFAWMVSGSHGVANGLYSAVDGATSRVSEPGSYAMILAGLLAIGAIARKRTQG